MICPSSQTGETEALTSTGGPLQFPGSWTLFPLPDNMIRARAPHWTCALYTISKKEGKSIILLGNVGEWGGGE